MGIFNFWKRRSHNQETRIIETVRGKEAVQKAMNKKVKLLFRDVEPFQTVSGKYCIVRDKKNGKKHILRDYRDSRAWNENFEIIQDWTYE